MTLKKIIVLFFLSTLFAFAQSLQADPIVIKFSHVVAPDTPKGKAALFFAQRAEELTRGAVKVQVYPNATLYKDKEEMEALQFGAVHILAPSLVKLTQAGVPEFELFDLPYMFDNMEMLHKITQGEIGQSLLNKLESKGIKGLAFWDNGFKSFSANRPLKKPADFKGLSMRIQPSRVLASQIRALGATPQVISFSDTYSALRAKLIDGTENPHSNFYTQHLFEVQKHITVTNHGYLGYAVITNRRFWEGLPSSIRQQLLVAIKESTEYANKIAEEENKAALRAIIDKTGTSIYVPTEKERAEFRKAMAKTHIEMTPYIGQEIIEAIYRETGFNPAKM